MVIRLPLEPYWHNAITWYQDHVDVNDAQGYLNWMSDQGVIGLPRKIFTNYLEFENDADATAFVLRWG